jgi:hypothetical protein
MLRRWIGLGSIVLALSGCYSYEPPGGKFVKLSQLAHFPDFYPGLGTIYVQPDTMPIGPYFGYDRLGHQVNTIYMVPMTFFEEHQVDQLIQGSDLKVDHVTLAYTNGHPGVDQPHYHIILWHVSPEMAEKVQ